MRPGAFSSFSGIKTLSGIGSTSPGASLGFGVSAGCSVIMPQASISASAHNSVWVPRASSASRKTRSRRAMMALLLTYAS
jgi:hypothetical protein